MPRHIRIAALLTLAATCLTPTPAPAGTFTVHSCTTPSGRWTGIEGWTSAASSPTQGEDPGNLVPCNAGELGLEYGFTQSPVSAGKFLRWDFSAPPGTHISGLTLLRTFELGWPVEPGVHGRPYVYDAWHDEDLSANQLEFFFPPYGSDTVGTDFPPMLSQTGVSWDSVSLRLRCWELMGTDACGPYRAQVTIPRATFELTDTDAPVGVVSGGDLAGGGSLRGVVTLSFEAADAGAGVYRTVVAVDGDEVARQVIAANGGRCADVDPANGDAYEFSAPQPCPLDVSGQIALQTAGLPDGSHAVRVSVEDAAGNADVVFDQTVTTHNAPVATAAPALAGAAKVGSPLTAGTGQWDGAPTGFGYRWLRCDDHAADCAGIAGADGPSYTPTSADAYHRLRVEVTAENASGAATARSAPTAVVADAVGRTTPPPGGGAAPGPGGIDNLANPLGGLTGHVGNGTTATTGARLAIAFRRPGGRTATTIRSTRDRRWTVVGRLTGPDGRPIAGARLNVAWKVDGGRWVARGLVRTGRDGRLAYVLPPGPSRQVKLTYFAFSDSRGFLASNVLREDVLAPLTLRADRPLVTGERVVRLDGRVGGGAIPRTGVLVTLQGWQAGWGWRTFRTIRTARSGRWSTTYRFRLSAGRFGFRAVVPRQSGHPYVTTRSKPVYVTVR